MKYGYNPSRYLFRKRERRAVLRQIRRAWDMEQLADLDVADWCDVLDRYDWRCAYCRGPYEAIDHFLPLALGGGTTALNCIPACTACNSSKSDLHPVEWIKRVADTNECKSYLLEMTERLIKASDQ